VGKISGSIEARTRIPAVKMNGLGNEIVVVDLRGADVEISAEQARAIHRAEGLSFDQLMAVSDRRRADTAAFVRIYNNDGSEAGACGNGTRCVAYWLMRGEKAETLRLETAAGVLDCRREGEFLFRVDMGTPRFGWREIPLREAVADTRRALLPTGRAEDRELGPASLVNMGNPHAIFWVKDIAAIDLAAIGPRLEHHRLFPEKANISVAEVVARDHIRLRVWERGVGLTKACGSAACAALAAAVRLDLADRKAVVTLPGGDLTIEWRVAGDRVWMTGPVELERETSLALA
jgi:diaminopimelate epimerase